MTLQKRCDRYGAQLQIDSATDILNLENLKENKPAAGRLHDLDNLP